VERVKAARAELGGHDAGAPRELPLPAAGEHPVDHRAAGLEHEVDARMGDDLLRERLFQVPFDDPVALDQMGEVLRRRVAGEAEVPAGGLRVQDPAPARALNHVAFLQYGRLTAA
jgi:hypothetical protein